MVVELPKMPWDNQTLDKNNSHSKVAVFANGEIFILAPTARSSDYIYLCFNRALSIGTQKIEDGTWRNYSITYHLHNRKKWPHIVMKGKK